MFNLLRNKINNFVKKFKTDTNLSLKTKIKGITGKIKLNEKDIDNYLEKFEISLLESDVGIKASEEICKKIKENLLDKEFSLDTFDKTLKQEIKNILINELKKSNADLFETIKKIVDDKGHAILLFVGPNGAGKTTTIAKIAKRLKSDYGPIYAAADTWRAASQEQGKEWCKRLDIRFFGGQYKSDPASVAWRAVDFAKKTKNSVVLIDSAGRQSTNINLMRELEKIKRVNKPDITIFVGESTTGNTLVDQISEFDEFVGIDGVILTKIDIDEKGGSVLSVSIGAKKQIYLVAYGQEPEELKEFDAKEIVNRIVGG